MQYTEQSEHLDDVSLETIMAKTRHCNPRSAIRYIRPGGQGVIGATGSARAGVFRAATSLFLLAWACLFFLLVSSLPSPSVVSVVLLFVTVFLVLATIGSFVGAAAGRTLFTAAGASPLMVAFVCFTAELRAAVPDISHLSRPNLRLRLHSPEHTST